MFACHVPDPSHTTRAQSTSELALHVGHKALIDVYGGPSIGCRWYADFWLNHLSYFLCRVNRGYQVQEDQPARYLS